MVKEGVRDPGILHLRDWNTSVIFSGKEEAESMETWLGNMLPLKTYSFQQEM